MFSKLTNFLAGKKTYILAVIAVIVNFAVYMNWITVDQLTQLNAIFAFLGLGTLRAGINKV